MPAVGGRASCKRNVLGIDRRTDGRDASVNEVLAAAANDFERKFAGK